MQKGNKTMRGNSNKINMEASFYEDNAQFSTAISSNNLKRPLTLDLNSKPQPKKQRLNQSIAAATPLINTPELAMLKLNTPELEKIIMANNSLQTPTPSLVFPTKNGISTTIMPTMITTTSSCSKQVTLEQEDYAKGFVDALNSLRNSENSQNGSIAVNNINSSVVTTNGMSGGSITYTNLDESFPVSIKDEPQTVPNSPPLSPIDMEDQERIKLERKRQRNRVAASKCRKRKLERISKLEDKVKELKCENTDLAGIIKQLKEHVFQLKQQVIDHINAGCDVNMCPTMLQNK